MVLEQITSLLQQIDTVQFLSLTVAFCCVCALGFYMAYKRKREREEREANRNREETQKQLEEQGLNRNIPSDLSAALFNPNLVSRVQEKLNSNPNSDPNLNSKSFVETWLQNQINEGKIRLKLEAAHEHDPHAVKIGFLGDKYFKVVPVETGQPPQTEKLSQPATVNLPETAVEKYNQILKKEKEKVLAKQKSEGEEEAEARQFIEETQSDAQEEFNKIMGYISEEEREE